LSSKNNWNPPVDSEFFKLANYGPQLFAVGCPEHQFEGRYRLHAGDVYVEAGAFWARYGLVASHRVGPEGRVILIEGSPQNGDMIRHVVKLYGLANVEVVDGIVWSEDIETDFCVHGNPAGYRKALSNDLVNYPDDVIQVQAYKLDTLFEQLNVDTVNLLCCDVEGAEWEMVRGADRFFTEKRIRNVALAAYHDISQDVGVHGYTLIMRFLEERGYKDLEFHPDLPHYGGLIYGHAE